VPAVPSASLAFTTEDMHAFAGACALSLAFTTEFMQAFADSCARSHTCTHVCFQLATFSYH